VIPETATFEATVRAFSEASMARLQERTERLCRSIAAAHG
jgi:hippurate hydrolase